MNQEICSAETINYTTEENQKIQNTKHSGSFENTLDTATDTQREDIQSPEPNTHLQVDGRKKREEWPRTGDGRH